MSTKPRTVSDTDRGAEQAEPFHLEVWPVDRLIPSPRNARTHSAEQVAEIAGSIRAFGFTNPILVGEEGLRRYGPAAISAFRACRGGVAKW